MSCPLIVAALLLLLIPRFTSAASPWLETRSAHFTIVSNASEPKVRAIAADLERVRAALEAVRRAGPADAGTTRTRRPTVVIAVRSERDLKVPQYWEHRGAHPVAAYWGGPYQNDLVVRLNVPARERMPVLLHEYVHLLTHESIPDVPAWLDEGVSSVWQTAVIRDDAIRAIKTTAATELSYYYRAILASQAPAVDAEAYLRRAIELNADFAPAFERLAMVAADKGDREQAATLLRRAVALEPKNASTRSLLQQLLAHPGAR